MFSLKPFGGRVQSFSVLCIPTGGTHITSDMCAGIHISRGYTYDCDTPIDLCSTGVVLCQLSYQANRELVTLGVCMSLYVHDPAVLSYHQKSESECFLLKWYCDQKITSIFSSGFESVLA